jgi:photosystem II stability/assembly factor-like uncharacterized protein
MRNPRRLAGLATLAALPALGLAADAPKERSCWLRDGSAPSPKVVYLLCEQGFLFATGDAGATWAARETGVSERMRGLMFLDDKRGLIIGDHGLLLATDDGGRKWQPRDAGTKENLMDIAFVGESGWVVGYQGVILRTKDGGKTWSKQTSGTTQTLESVFFLDGDHGWAAGWAGTILRTSNGGEKWELTPNAAAQWSVTAIYFRDVSNGWLVGFNGQILRSTDGGATWKLQDSPVKSWLTSLAFDGSGKGWITFDDGLLVSQDSGATWKRAPFEGRYFLAKLLRVGPAVWAIGQSAVMQQKDGLAWKRMETLNLRNGAADPNGTP